MKKELIAPCGMNCNICMAYLREKNKCPGCRGSDTNKSFTRIRCRIKNCEMLKKTKSKFCFECEKIPCTRMRHLDKRYRTKYGMSMIDNLEFIKKHGVNKLIKKEEKKWKCQKCGGVISCHNRKCYVCDKTSRGIK